MRNIRKKRSHFAQIAVILLLFASVVLHPKAGASDAPDAEGARGVSHDKVVISTTSETKITENVTVAERKTVVLPAGSAGRAAEENAPSAASGDSAVPLNAAPVYDQSVYRALKHQGLTPEHIGVWRDEHPLSTLHYLDKQSPAKQRKVANLAAFIRKTNPKISAKTAWREACAVVFYSEKYKVSPDLVAAIAKAESRFNPAAQSKAGALGVMQVMWKVHNGMLRAKGIAPTREHMFDPERGVEAGILILSRYMSAYGTVQKALNRYYGGIAHGYIKKVNGNMAMLQRHSESTGY